MVKYCYFEGHNFHNMSTDHEPLTLFGQTLILVYCLNFITKFTTEIQFFKGSQSAVADDLSKIASMHKGTTSIQHPAPQ